MEVGNWRKLLEVKVGSWKWKLLEVGS